MLEWLKTILGDGYNEEIDKKVSAEIGKSFVAKADFDAKNSELKTVKDQLAEAGTTIEGFRAMDIDGIKKAAEEYKAKAEQAEKDAAAQLEDYKFGTWLDGLIAQNKGRDPAVIRTLAGEERLQALRTSQNRDADAKALFEELHKQSAYAFEDQTPPPPPYAGGTGAAALLPADDAAMRSAMNLPAAGSK